MDPRIAELTVTHREVAQIFNCSPQTIWRWVNSGYLGSREVAGVRRATVAGVQKRLGAMPQLSQSNN